MLDNFEHGQQLYKLGSKLKFLKILESLLRLSSARKYLIETCVSSITDTTVGQCNKKDLNILVNFRSSY